MSLMHVELAPVRARTPRLRRVFNVDGKEFIFLVLIALVVLGPEKLPDAFRRAGRVYSEFRRMADGFQQEFRQVLDAPKSEFDATVDVVRESVDLRHTGDPSHVDGDAPGSADAPEDGPASTDSLDQPGSDEPVEDEVELERTLTHIEINSRPIPTGDDGDQNDAAPDESRSGAHGSDGTETG